MGKIDLAGSLRRLLAGNEQIIEPAAGFIETWQGVYISERLWTPTNPLTGTPWAISTDGPTKKVSAVPALSETARLAGNRTYMVSPGNYGVNTITRKVTLEWTFKLANLANINNATTFMGFCTGVADLRTTNDIVCFCWLADVLQALTDSAGAETSTACAVTITDVNKFKIEVMKLCGQHT
jgi:hypothetical protein